MPEVISQTPLLVLTQIFLSGFLAILFLQSGFDKVTNRASNLSWLQGHFANSVFKNSVQLLLTILTVLELLAGGLSLAGIAGLVIWKTSLWAALGAILSAVALLSMFFGQRIAKDYTGAAGLVPYFLVVIFYLYLLN